jgi:o-succinylbenzoate synthase
MWISSYTLTPRRPLSPKAGARPRHGALLRSGDGFADIHPWPELGDAPLHEQLAKLARGQTTPLTRRSLEIARIDGAARANGVSLFAGLTIPASHWPGADPPPGFDTVKLKGIESIPPAVRLRIDFNRSLSPEAFMMIAEGLPAERVDFVEDPCEYDAAVWTALREQTGLRLALDRPSEYGGLPPRSAVDVLVVKPAIEDVPQDSREIVITSYMDHPVGQFGAAYFAAKFGSARCGLFTHVLFQANEFIDRIRSDGARLLPPEGTGVGFDDLLERLPWKKLT